MIQIEPHPGDAERVILRLVCDRCGSISDQRFSLRQALYEGWPEKALAGLFGGKRDAIKDAETGITHLLELCAACAKGPDASP